MTTSYPNFSDLIGKTLTSVEIQRGNDVPNDAIIFTASNGERWKLYHRQDCCESVGIEDIEGQVSDLVDSPILRAEESSNEGQESEYGETSTWTFYRLATAKGCVTIRWLGSSNGYYSESVDFEKL